MASYMQTETPKELANKALEVVEIARNSGKLRRGMNEVTKIVERGQAKLVVIATDINPPEIVMHLPALCAEKQIPIVFAGKKDDLGAAAGLDVPTSVIAVQEIGDAKNQYKDIIEHMKKK
jgi:large subunit ribosomal protein L7Ae